MSVSWLFTVAIFLLFGEFLIEGSSVYSDELVFPVLPWLLLCAYFRRSTALTFILDRYEFFLSRLPSCGEVHQSSLQSSPFVAANSHDAKFFYFVLAGFCGTSINLSVTMLSLVLSIRELRLSTSIGIFFIDCFDSDC